MDPGLLEIGGYATAVVTGALGWLTARSKYSAVAAQTVEARLDKILLQLHDLNAKLLAATLENGRLEAENASLKEKWRSLNIQYAQLKKFKEDSQP